MAHFSSCGWVRLREALLLWPLEIQEALEEASLAPRGLLWLLEGLPSIHSLHH